MTLHHYIHSTCIFHSVLLCLTVNLPQCHYSSPHQNTPKKADVPFSKHLLKLHTRKTSFRTGFLFILPTIYFRNVVAKTFAHATRTSKAYLLWKEHHRLLGILIYLQSVYLEFYYNFYSIFNFESLICLKKLEDFKPLLSETELHAELKKQNTDTEETDENDLETWSSSKLMLKEGFKANFSEVWVNWAAHSQSLCHHRNYSFACCQEKCFWETRVRTGRCQWQKCTKILSCVVSRNEFCLHFASVLSCSSKTKRSQWALFKALKA